jgi:hypothetical protein
LKRAVELDGSNKLYRNNLAAVYVEQNQSDLALAELTAAHGTAVGHYNLGYLLVQKGDSRAALAHFQRASQTDRNLVAAQQWVAKLTMPPGVPASQGGATMVAQAPQGAYATPAQATTPPAYVAQRPQSYAPATSSRAPATGPPRPEPMPPTPRY